MITVVFLCLRNTSRMANSFATAASTFEVAPGKEALKNMMVRSINGMTSTGAFPGLWRSQTTKTPPTTTTRGVFDVCSSAPLIEFKLASFIHSFLKLLIPTFRERLVDLARLAPQSVSFIRRPRKLISRIRISVVMTNHGMRTTSTLT